VVNGVQGKAGKSNIPALSTSGKELLMTMGGIAAAIAIVVAGIAIMATAVDANRKKEEKAAEQAKALAKAVSAGFDEAKASYEELNNTVSNYESAREGLKELTKGTLEYNDAIQEANESAMALLEK